MQSLMNSFLLPPPQADSTYEVDLHQQTLEPRKQKFQVAQRVKGFERGGDRLWLEVLKQDDHILHLHALERIPAPERLPITAIVGVSRPQTMKKVLHIAQTCGVSTLVLLQAEYSEKSYFHSEVLQAENITRELELAMMQAWDPLPCEVLVKRDFWKFLKDDLPRLASQNDLRLLADQDGQANLPYQESNTSLILSIGPETGWSNDEKNAFDQAGFLRLRLGERILRVETAMAMCLGWCASLQAR